MVKTKHGAVTLAGGPAIISTFDADFPANLTVIPQSGDTVKVEYSTTAGAAQNPTTANWIVSATLGAVTAIARESIPSPVTAIRLTTTAGSGTDAYEFCYS